MYLEGPYVNGLQMYSNWNDRRSRCLLLTSAKFQTFAYNSITVWSSYVKFGSSLKLMNCAFVTTFEAIDDVAQGCHILQKSCFFLLSWKVLEFYL